MNPTTVHSSEVVGQLVLIEADRHATHIVSTFVAGASR